jgi:anti-sigma factor RsiW
MESNNPQNYSFATDLSTSARENSHVAHIICREIELDWIPRCPRCSSFLRQPKQRAPAKNGALDSLGAASMNRPMSLPKTWKKPASARIPSSAAALIVSDIIRVLYQLLASSSGSFGTNIKTM